MRGCLFHFAKAIMSKVSDLALLHKFFNDYTFRCRVKNLTSLAYLPAADITDVYITYAAGTFLPDEWGLRDYFTRTYIGELKRNSVERKMPSFPPSFWTLHGRDAQGIDTTTNACERFHRTFTDSFANPNHLSPPVFLTGLKKQQTGRH